MSIFFPSFPAAFTIKTSFFAAYAMASKTHSLLGEKRFPKLVLMIFAPLSTAYLIPKATSLSCSSPSGTTRTVIIFTVLATPFAPLLLSLEAATIPATCVPCFSKSLSPITLLFP